MADNDEQDETEQVQDAPASEQSQEPVQLAQLAPPTPPPVLSEPPAQPQGVPVVPFTIGRRDPVTGEMTTVRGFGARAPARDPNAAFWSQLRERTSNLPLAQAEAAATAAIRFQGIRQYQRDLESGMAPEQAYARAALLLFNAPRQSSLGQAAQFMRAARPTPKFQSVGGVLYRENPDGTVTAVSGPGRPRFHSSRGVLYREGPNGTLEPATTGTAKTSPFDTEEYRSVLTEIRAANKELTDMTAGEPTLNAEQAKDIEPLRNRLRFLQGQLESIRSRATGGPAERSPQRPQAPRPSEVVRYTKEGRRAVFDSNSRKFVRYLD